MNNNVPKRGFIQLIIILVLIVVVLSLLGVSLRTLFSSATLQDNFGFVGEWLRWFWNSYLGAPFRIVFENLIKPIWDRFLHALQGGLSFEIPQSKVQFNTAKASSTIR